MKLLIINLIFLSWTTYSIGQGKESKKRDKDKEKRIEVFTKWLNKNDIVFRQLPKANPDELIYDCDSIPIIKQIKGDTLIFWTKSQWSVTGGLYLDNDIKELDKQIRKESFGRTDYVEGLDEQGNVVLVSLLPKKFKIENDSLFQLTSFFRIPQDSIEKAITEGKFELAKKLLRENVYFKFVLIFHPDLFREKRVFENNEAGDKIILDHIWKVGEKKYYEISFNNDNHGTMVKFPIYLFDDKYRFPKYDGCNASELSQLTREKELND